MITVSISYSETAKKINPNKIEINKKGNESETRTVGQSPRVEKLPAIKSVNIAGNLTEYASLCTVFVDHPSFALYDWLEGDEAYFAYQNLFYPLYDCDSTYPFVVTHIGMTVVLNSAGTLPVQIFIAEVDPVYSSPVCPVPGALLIASEIYEVNVPAPDVYTITIEFETPAVVHEPWFAGFYFPYDVTAFTPGIAIDTIPYLCINYNDWGYGTVDLATNEYYPFPGSIHLFSAGYPAKAKLPKIQWLIPPDSGVINPFDQVWVAELNDTFDYQMCRFEYYNQGEWYLFDADFDGFINSRNSLTVPNGGTGWTGIWDPYAVTEGNYLLRVMISDTDSTNTLDTITVYLDKKSLKPNLINRSDFQAACTPDTLFVAIEDENPVAVSFAYYALPITEYRQLTLLDRLAYGDTNGNPSDGNHYWADEYGEYFSAPVIFASQIDYWYDQGFIELMFEDAIYTPLNEIVNRLAADFKIYSNLGAEDDNVAYAVREYINSHSDRMETGIQRYPSWDWVISLYSAHQATIALAVQNPFGHWLAIKDMNYTDAIIDSLPITIYDPVGGLVRDSYLLNRNDSLFIGYLPNNKAYFVDLGIAIYPQDDTITYTVFGTDFDNSDGFSVPLEQASFSEDLTYLIRAKAIDDNDDVASAYWIMRYECNSVYLRGDADYGGTIDISDAVYLINYIFDNGPSPYPSLLAGDADCNNQTNISDAVFIINFIFDNGPPPCDL